MPSRIAVVLLTAFGLALAMPAAAQWKWRDKNGQTQYSDLPPPSGVTDQDILQRPSSTQRKALPAVAVASATSAAPLLAAKGSEPELEAKRKKAEADEAATKKAEEAKLAKARAENCSRAQGQLRTLDSGVRIARTAANGEREYLDDTQRAAEAKRARDIAASECK